MFKYTINSKPISFSDIKKLINNKNTTIHLANNCSLKIIKCRNYLDKKLNESNQVFYGINTGFGFLCDKTIGKKQLHLLQENLIRSHACGLGQIVPIDIVRLMYILKIKSFGFGFSGVSIELVQALIELYNKNSFAVIYSQGSLGASGDLAPLSHLALNLIGEGEVHYKGNVLPMKTILSEINFKPITLQSKEGLALINGTQFMLSYGLYILTKLEQLSIWADFISCLSLTAFKGSVEAFNLLTHQSRPHQGQIQTAYRLLKFMDGANYIPHGIQDPYSFRCIPQVHGASKDVFEQVEFVFLTEANSVTDNPLIFPDQDKIISGGNFHGQPLALQLDFLAIAIAELASISERRTYQLIGGQRELPIFLTNNSGIESGFMIAQYTAASIVSQNKQLCTPASVDTIPSSNNQEDHVSMGANAATKCLTVLENTEKVLAIELLTALQALGFREPTEFPNDIKTFYLKVTEDFKFIKKDIIMFPEIKKAIYFLQNNSLDDFLFYKKRIR